MGCNDISNSSILVKLAELIDESRELLKDADVQEPVLKTLEILPSSLLDQCLELCQQHNTQVQEPIRTLHHFGLPADSHLLTSIATIANIHILKDIHPENNSVFNDFKSKTLVSQNINPANQEETRMDDESRSNAFLRDLKQFEKDNREIGKRLFISNNHCIPLKNESMNVDLITLLNREFKTRSVVVVADPIDSYKYYILLAQPDKLLLNFDDYCQHILTFLQMHSGLTIIRHEDFVTDPENVMKTICLELDLPFNEQYALLREAFE